MKNFKITAKENGKEYWISRAHAVVGIVYAVKNVFEILGNGSRILELL